MPLQCSYFAPLAWKRMVSSGLLYAITCVKAALFSTNIGFFVVFDYWCQSQVLHMFTWLVDLFAGV